MASTSKPPGVERGRVRLSLEPDRNEPNFRFRERGTAHDSVVQPIRLRAFVDLTENLPPNPPQAHLQAALFADCIIDTGAPFTVIPYELWKMFPHAVEWLDTPGGRQTLTILGGRFRYRPGRISFRIFNWGEPHFLPPRGVTMRVTILAMFLDEYSIGKSVNSGARMILGLRGGAIDGRILHAGPDPNAPFGQSWFLEDP